MQLFLGQKSQNRQARRLSYGGGKKQPFPIFQIISNKDKMWGTVYSIKYVVSSEERKEIKEKIEDKKRVSSPG